MEIKGELKRNGLPSLFRNFATENFHGVLTVTSAVGEKLITLTENEITVYCDELNEASRLGDILLARGVLTEETLDATLRDQRKLDPRPKLGDMLVKRGLVPEKAIFDARRFQIEEDICDILSWKKGRFSFAGADSAREIHPEDFAPDQVHRLTIDPDTFFKSVTKMTEDWDAIGDRLPTQYLCFKLSTKVSENMSTFSVDTQRILRFLKEGRSIEGAVRHSCLGRIQVCVLVIELLEKGMVLPASGADLRFFASEHRAQKRLHDALYIYRRLLESPDSKEERPYLENLIEEITEQIARLKQSGEYGEEAVIVSHREAKERYVQKRTRRKLFWWITGPLAAAGILFLILHSSRPPEDLPQRYRDTIVKVDQLISEGKFNEAIALLDEIDKSFPDKESHAAISIRDRKARIPQQLHTYLENQLAIQKEQILRGGEARDEALKFLRGLLEQYPESAQTERIKALIREYDVTKPLVVEKPADPGSVAPDMPTREQLQVRLRNADELKSQQHYIEASREFYGITQSAPANGDIWKRANEGAKEIKSNEEHANDLVSQSLAAWGERNGEKALKTIDQALGIFGDLDGANNAAALKARWSQAKSSAEQMFKTAKEFEDKNSFFDARGKYELLYRSYPEFPIAAEAHKKADEMKIKCDAQTQLLELALKAREEKDYPRMRAILGPLMEFNESLLVDNHVEIPVAVSTDPAGADLKLNGKLMPGKTPMDVMITAGEAYEIVVERNGYAPAKRAAARLTIREFVIPIKLELEPIVVEFPAPPLAPPAPLLAPPIWFDNHVVVLNGPDMIAVDLPNKEVQWTVHGLYERNASLPENASLDDRNYWNCRNAPTPFKPGFLLLPLRNKELLELDLRNPAQPVTRSLFQHFPVPLPEIAGTIYAEEHSKLAGKSMFVAAFVDGQIRCFVNRDNDNKKSDDFTPKWSLPLDPDDSTRKEPPAAGLYGYRAYIWALSGGGTIQKIDPIAEKAVFHKDYHLMSPRSTFSSDPNDPLAALVQRNGKVIIFDLEHEDELWSLPERQAMEESVGVLIDKSGIFVTSRKGENGELSKYPRAANMVAGAPKAVCSVKLDGFVNLDMASGKYLYLITHLSKDKVFCYSKTDLKLLWEFTLKPEMGEPRSLRVFGDYVYVATDKGKLIVLRAE